MQKTGTADRPNILWFCADQQRWDTVGALGQSEIRTPHLDALAGRGVAFRRAYTQSQVCTPARASMLTGRYPASHHVYRNGNAWFPGSEVLVTRMLADAGYDCGLIGKLHLTAAKYYEQRPDDGYRTFLWSHHPTPDFARGHDYETWLRHEKGVDPVELFDPVNYFCGPGVPSEYHQTTWCAEMAIRFISEQRVGPWMLSVNPFDPHAPFDAPQEYLDRVRDRPLSVPLFKDGDSERQKRFLRVDQQAKVAMDPRIRRRIESKVEAEHDLIASKAPESYDALEVKRNYYAMIEQIDDQFARIVEALRSTGQLDNTLIIYMSDHGEMLGDHGLVLKGCRFFDGLVRIPMILSWPARYRQGLISEALVESVDIAPTLLEAAGLAIPPSMQGRSLGDLLEGRAEPHRHKAHVVCEYKDSMGGHPDHTHGSMVFDGRYKSVVYHGHGNGELFDTEVDPGEFDDLWCDPSQAALKAERLAYHLDALAGTISAGPERAVAY